jgi:hypothetical protein
MERYEKVDQEAQPEYGERYKTCSPRVSTIVNAKLLKKLHYELV